MDKKLKRIGIFELIVNIVGVLFVIAMFAGLMSGNLEISSDTLEGSAQPDGVAAALAYAFAMIFVALFGIIFLLPCLAINGIISIYGIVLGGLIMADNKTMQKYPMRFMVSSVITKFIAILSNILTAIVIYTFFLSTAFVNTLSIVLFVCAILLAVLFAVLFGLEIAQLPHLKKKKKA